MKFQILLDKDKEHKYPNLQVRKKEQVYQAQEGARDGRLECEEKYIELMFINLLSQDMNTLQTH